MRVLAYLHGTQELGLQYIADHDLVGFVDSAYGDDKDTLHSTMGYALMYNGAVVSWASKKQMHVATSTVEAEYASLELRRHSPA
jgi:hypothetical protein